MAVRSVWKGSLKLGLAMVPAKMIAATETADKVRFNNLHDTCHGRVTNKNWCAACAEEVTKDEILHGFEIRKGEYVIVEDSELEAVADEESSMLDVTLVSAEAAIDPARIDSTLFLVPADKGATRAFETLRIALGDRLAIGTVVIRKKACLVALQAAEDVAFIVYKLRSDAQVRDFGDLDLPDAVAPVPAELALAKRLMAGMEGRFSYADVEDEYTIRLRAFLDAKDKGQVAVPLVRKTADTTTLAQALEMSLQAAQAAAPAKTPPVLLKVKMAKAKVAVSKTRKAA
jgi:DNA end-binding protein Ku